MSQKYSQKRLRELEKQVKEYTDEDLLKEADELEREMMAGNINYELPEDFFQQILAKGKLIEAERSMYDNDTVKEPKLGSVLKPIVLEDNKETTIEIKSQAEPKWWQFWKRK